MNNSINDLRGDDGNVFEPSIDRRCVTCDDGIPYSISVWSNVRSVVVEPMD